MLGLLLNGNSLTKLMSLKTSKFVFFKLGLIFLVGFYKLESCCGNLSSFDILLYVVLDF